MLICPICANTLQLNKNQNSCDTYKCINNHSFDVSKFGYINLLVGKTDSGDNKEMVKARREFLNKDYYKKLSSFINDKINSLNVKDVLDLGCGEGYYDRNLTNINSLIGLDISKEAITLASKAKLKNATYIVGSSYHIPLSEKSIDLSMSIFSPIDINEIKRVTKSYFIKVIPNKNHLLELKEDLYENVYLNEIKDSTYDGLSLISEDDITYSMDVKDVNELFKMTPYYYTTHNNYSLNLEEKEITFSFLVRIYKIN